MMKKEKEEDKHDSKFDSIKITQGNFINEKTGNIKDFYKITGCIGRGKKKVSNL